MLSLLMPLLVRCGLPRAQHVQAATQHPQAPTFHLAQLATQKLRSRPHTLLRTRPERPARSCGWRGRRNQSMCAQQLA